MVEVAEILDQGQADAGPGGLMGTFDLIVSVEDVPLVLL